MTSASPRPLQPGDKAPGFTLSTVQGDRTVSLGDYRGRTALFLCLFRGLYCPFCRRSIAQMAVSAEKLKPLGVESLAVVATDLENARLYYRFRPTRVALAVDPELTTHRSYGVPRLELTAEIMETMSSLRVNPSGELPEPMSPDDATNALNAIDRFQPTASDLRDADRQAPGLLDSQFLIDHEGFIRWLDIEGSREGPAGFGKFPTSEEVLAAARMLTARRSTGT